MSKLLSGPLAVSIRPAERFSGDYITVMLKIYISAGPATVAKSDRVVSLVTTYMSLTDKSG